MVTNPKFFGQSTTGTQSQIEDGIDFPHTGLLKALSTASSGRYALSGFNITVAGTTGITVAAGETLYNGKVTAVTGASLTLSATHTNGYHLLVAPRPTNEDSDAATPLTSTVVLRNPAAANKVPAFVLGDTIIAVITHTGSAPFLQYLTYDKTSQAFSIAHDNSTDGTGVTYTEMGTIEATSTGIVMKASSATGGADIVIETADSNRDIVFKGNDGGTPVTALTLDMSEGGKAIFAGEVTSAGTVLTGGGVVANHGDNRIVTSGAANTNLNGESNLTFNGSTNVLAVTGGITGTTLTTTGLITTTANNITAPSGSVSAVSIGGGTGGISNAGKYTQSQELAADAAGGYGVTRHGHVNIIDALFPNTNLIDCAKEHYYVGLDTQISATHNAGNPVTPTGATGELQLLTVANETNRVAGNLTAHTYPVDTVFGGNTFFVGIQKPESHIGRTISITNITAYGLYVLVGNENAADQSQAAQRRRMNGGQWNSTHPTGMLSHKGNTRCVNMSRILTGTSQIYPVSTSFGGDWDAILVKPRETITLSALELQAENPGTHQQDVFNQQGLHNFPTGPAGLTGMWFLKSVTSSAGFANVGNLNNAFVHIPVWMTGTTFICIGTNQVMLPSHPPIGTQYSFLVKQGTTNLDRITLGGAEAHMASSYATSSAQDEFYELSATLTSAPLSVAAGNGKTVIYTEDRNWEVIG